jgi:restriction endonuclease Mrr
MPSPVSLWHQRLPEETDRRLEHAEATAREDLVETHAHLALELIQVLAPRMAFDEAIDRYIESMRLQDEDAETVGTRAVALMDAREIRDDIARENTRGWGFNWRYATPLGALRFIQRHRKRAEEEQLWLELAAARAEERLADAHARHAQRFVEILEDEVDPTRAVELYVERLKLPDVRARIVYQRVLARLAEELLPRLREGASPRDEAAPEPPAKSA